jgi:hypothetical protein
MSTADTIEQLRTAALRQPGARERASGMIKFQCPQCAADGHDAHQDNAGFFIHDGKWGCAFASSDSAQGRAHWEAIGLALGVRGHQSPNGHVSTPTPDGADQPPSDAEPWATPEPVRADLVPVPAFDLDRMLPAAFTGWISDIATRSQCPIDFVAVGALSALASVVGRSVAIRPKKHDDWTVVPNLWGLVIGRPGIMKSPALGEALKPLQRLVADAHEAYREELKAFEFEQVKVEAQKSVLKERLKKAVRDGGDVDALQAQFDALDLEPPTERRYLVNDTSIEKLGELLNQNPNGLLVFRDELAGFLNMMDREGHEGDRAFYCEAWNGSGAFVYDRIGRGTVRIEAACVSLLGGLQPGPLHSYLREVFGSGATDDGLIQRFQLLVFPDTTSTWTNIDRWPDAEAKTRAFEIFRQLAHGDPLDLGAHQDAHGDLPYLRFTPEAQVRFDGWRSALETHLRQAGEHPVLVSHLAKYRSLMPSLALLFHLADCVVKGAGGPVSDAAAERAVTWTTYLKAHARRVYESVTAGPKVAAARLATEIQAGKLSNPFTARTARLKGWTGLQDPEEVAAAIAVLEEMHWLRPVEVPPTAKGGRRTVTYWINPAVQAGGRR